MCARVLGTMVGLPTGWSAIATPATELMTVSVQTSFMRRCGSAGAAGAEIAQRLERELAIQQEVGDEYHQAAPAEVRHDSAQRRLRRGAFTRLERTQDLQQLTPVAQARPRGSDRSNVIVEGDETGRIPLPDQDQRERGNQPPGIIQLGEDQSR